MVLKTLNISFILKRIVVFEIVGERRRVQSEHFQEIDVFLGLKVEDEIQIVWTVIFLQILQVVEAELRFMAASKIVHIIAEIIYDIIYKYCNKIIRKKNTFTFEF